MSHKRPKGKNVAQIGVTEEPRGKGAPSYVSAKSPRGKHNIEFDMDRQKFRWRTEKVDLRHSKWGWHVLSHDRLLLDVIPKLHQFETMYWENLRSNGSHLIPLDRISAEARRYLAENGYEDMQELYSLRLTGPIRVWGIREGNILYLLLWDGNHEICPSHLT